MGLNRGKSWPAVLGLSSLQEDYIRKPLWSEIQSMFSNLALPMKQSLKKKTQLCLIFLSCFSLSSEHRRRRQEDYLLLVSWRSSQGGEGGGHGDSNRDDIKAHLKLRLGYCKIILVGGVFAATGSYQSQVLSLWFQFCCS